MRKLDAVYSSICLTELVRIFFLGFQTFSRLDPFGEEHARM